MKIGFRRFHKRLRVSQISKNSRNKKKTEIKREIITDVSGGTNVQSSIIYFDMTNRVLSRF